MRQGKKAATPPPADSSSSSAEQCASSLVVSPLGKPLSHTIHTHTLFHLVLQTLLPAALITIDRSSLHPLLDIDNSLLSRAVTLCHTTRGAGAGQGAD